jgi:ribosome maturation protein SDO1
LPTHSEKDVDEVLQIANVFTNVSKGAVAKTTDLQSCFRTTSIPDIVREILLKGELQVGEKERSHALGNLWKEVAGLVADKVVDPATKRPYSVSMVEKAMQEVHFNVRAERSAKSQVSCVGGCAECK